MAGFASHQNNSHTDELGAQHYAKCLFDESAFETVVPPCGDSRAAGFFAFVHVVI
jgi:hypothetical protein